MAAQQSLMHIFEPPCSLVGQSCSGFKSTGWLEKGNPILRSEIFVGNTSQGRSWQSLRFSRSEVAGCGELNALCHGREGSGECSTSNRCDTSSAARGVFLDKKGGSIGSTSGAYRTICSSCDASGSVILLLTSRSGRVSIRPSFLGQPLAAKHGPADCLGLKLNCSLLGHEHSSRRRSRACQASQGFSDLLSSGTDQLQGLRFLKRNDLQLSLPSVGWRSLGHGFRGDRRDVRASAAAFGEFSPARPLRVGREQIGQKKRAPPRELLSQVRKRKELERLQREREALYDPPDPAAKAVWPFWRKKGSDEEVEARQLTRRIVSLGKRKQLDQIFQVLAQAKKDGVRVNLITVNAALAACVNCGDVDKALAVFDAMVRPGGVGADGITYGTLLKGLGQAKRLDEAFELIEAMEDGTAPGMPRLTEVHINTLVNACAEAGEALRARGVLSRYRNLGQGAANSVLTCNLLIKGYARSDNPLEALNVMEEMRLLGLPLQRVTYNCLILACVRGGDLETALDLLEEMKSEARRLKTAALLPDVVTYTTVLKALAEDGDLEGIRQLVKDMKNMPTCVIDRVAYTAIIDACITAGSAEDGVRFMAEMEAEAKREPELRPRAHVFLALMRALAERADVARTLELATRMVPDASGHVWPEDRAEADELVMEAALNAGELRLARGTMAGIIKAQKGKPSLTPRGTQALVRLMAVADFPYTRFQPILFRNQVAPRSAVDTAMVRLDEARPLQPHQTVAEVAKRFLTATALPVVDSQRRCVGVVCIRDCQKLEDRVEDIMQPPPPRIPHKALILQAVDLLRSEKAELLVVVKGRRGLEISKGSFRQGGSSEYYIEEDEEVLGFIGTRQLFDRDSDPLTVEDSFTLS